LGKNVSFTHPMQVAAKLLKSPSTGSEPALSLPKGRTEEMYIDYEISVHAEALEAFRISGSTTCKPLN
jgi:hypothetical protein